MPGIAQMQKVVAKNIWQSLPANTKRKIVAAVVKKKVVNTATRGKEMIKDIFPSHAKKLDKSYLKGVEGVANTKNVGDISALSGAYGADLPAGVKKNLMDRYMRSSGYLFNQEKAYTNMAKAMNPATTARQLSKMDPIEASRYLNNYERLVGALPRDAQSHIMTFGGIQ